MEVSRPTPAEPLLRRCGVMRLVSARAKTGIALGEGHWENLAVGRAFLPIQRSLSGLPLGPFHFECHLS